MIEAARGPRANIVSSDHPVGAATVSPLATQQPRKSLWRSWPFYVLLIVGAVTIGIGAVFADMQLILQALGLAVPTTAGATTQAATPTPSPLNLLPALFAPIIVALFGYLIIDRLREMGTRIERVDERTSATWISISREIQETASRQAESTLRRMQDDLETNVSRLQARLQETLEANRWMAETNPERVAIRTKHLEPVLDTVRALVRADQKERATGLVIQALNDPEMRGTPNDYHNLGVTVSVDLSDDLLAAQVYERALSIDGGRDPDVVADALNIYTKADRGRAKEVAHEMEETLARGDVTFTMRWRPWVFLSDYYLADGDVGKAREVLLEGLNAVRDITQRPHLYQNLGDLEMAAGDTTKSEEYLRTCLQESPMFFPAITVLARLLWRTGRVAEARSMLETSVAVGNIDPSLDNTYGLACAYLARLKFGEGNLISATHHGVIAHTFGTGMLAREVLQFAGLSSKLGPGDNTQDG